MAAQSNTQGDQIQVKKKFRENDQFMDLYTHVLSLAPIQPFPNEILAEIFQFGVSMPEDPFATLPFQHTISSVVVGGQSLSPYHACGALS